ncbi:hypothetical protein ACFSSC_10725 [Corynebacterium mendelii]|uniref:Uncharacterized protein n=1 Tax=Corynebacterium mendelii TaxID=2765362 RepID=A0A939IVP1_9CORY|nr:hypothetical protein [Corynebacterium mendelii]MBN9644436.1 hypothetical protein [Corynebacterium mendelii]
METNSTTQSPSTERTFTVQILNPVSNLGINSGFLPIPNKGPGFSAVNNIGRLTGFIEIRNLVPIIDNCTLDSNPRFSRRGEVTDEIEETIALTPELLPFKSKGILMAVPSVVSLDRNRVSLTIENPMAEGILDGGHNALAAGLSLLRKTSMDRKEFNKIKTWKDLKQAWGQFADELDAIRRDPDENKALMPLEILFPANPDDESCVAYFNEHLLEVCAARNNNVQLAPTTTANQEGLLDPLKQVLAGCGVTERIQWKTNGEGTIAVPDVTALAWIPLSAIDLPVDDDGMQVTALTGRSAYAQKGLAFKRYKKLMSCRAVSSAKNNDYQREVDNEQVWAAHELLPDIVRAYDYIQCNFAEAYNATGGKFGRITSVQAVNKGKSPKSSKFFGKPVATDVPLGFLMPVVFALRVLITQDQKTKLPMWRDNMDPVAFLEEHLAEIVKEMRGLYESFNFDPQKVGKENHSYSAAEAAVKNIYMSAMLGM